ncbi:MAG TPA: DNA polymerase III subunit alpha [Bacillota bacterium]
MSFTHLQVRSGYSLMDSTITIEKLVKKAFELGFEAIALTDENVLYGVIPFYKMCKRYGIKPIIGLSIHVIDEEQTTEQVILLAKNNKGYQQLIKISSHINLHEQLSLAKTDLRQYTKDLICILPVHTSKLKQQFHEASYEQIHDHVKQWEEMFARGDFYLGIADHGLQSERTLHKPVQAFQETYRIPVVAIHDVRYLNAGDDLAYDCLQAMKDGKKCSPQKMDPTRKQRHLRTEIEMERIFGAVWPEVLQETERVAAKCHVSLDFTKRKLPTYPVPKDMTAHEYLEKLCWRQVKATYKTVTEEITKRLAYELEIIQTMGFSDYFLIVWDFVKYAKENNILVGPGRGSSAGSVVAYVLNITEVDPIKHDLLFERFLNPERITMPDIDIDFSDHRRDEVIEYVRQKYGSEHVAQIITFGTFAARSVVREMIKTCNVDERDAAFILRHIPVQSGQTLREIVATEKELKEYMNQSKTLQLFFSIAVTLEGLPRHISTHAAGVIISEQPLIQHVPLTIGANGMRLTQYSMDELEALGLLKIDFLGLRNLTLLERIVHSIRLGENKQITLKKIPHHDDQTFQLLQRGKTNGIFQLESNGMKRVLARLKPTAFEDIVAVNALYRPGPMEFIQVYIDRKHKRQRVDYPHSDLEPILKSTYGVLIYQEQIMQIAHKIAGYSLGQADLLRRAISKKNERMITKQREKFIQGCLTHGYDQQVAEELFHWIMKFSNYGFPKSHAVAYSKISYQLAYLKTHYPKYFFAELLSSVLNQQKKSRTYIKELKELNVTIAPPSINKSIGKYTVEQQGIRMGLLAIKGIGNQVVKEIVKARKQGPFKHLFDFCLRVPLKVVNRKVIEQLILAGAFDETYSNRASLLASLDQAIERGELFKEFVGQASLFQDELTLQMSYVDIEDFSQVKKLADEKELLGTYISSHPLQQYRKQLRKQGFVTIQNIQKLKERMKIKSTAIIQAVKPIRTKRGDRMAFVTLSDETNEIEAVVFPDLFRKINRWLQEEMVVTLQGQVEDRNDRKQLLVRAMKPFDAENFAPTEHLFIKLTKQSSEEALDFIKQLTRECSGKMPIIIYHPQSKRAYRLTDDYLIQLNEVCLQTLYNYFGRKNVVVK